MHSLQQGAASKAQQGAGRKQRRQDLAQRCATFLLLHCRAHASAWPPSHSHGWLCNAGRPRVRAGERLHSRQQDSVRSAAFENTAIRSSSFFACLLTRASPPDSYIIMPDMLKNAPMFKKAAVASKMARSSNACGRRYVRLTVSCHSQGRGGGGRGRGGGGRGGGRVSAS